MTTGQIIKDVRNKAGLTQSQLAEKLGVPYQSVSQWERDVRNPRYETLVKIADALGMNVQELFYAPIEAPDISKDYPRLVATKDALENWREAIDSELKAVKKAKDSIREEDGSKCNRSEHELETIQEKIREALAYREQQKNLERMEERRAMQLEQLSLILNRLSPSALLKVTEYAVTLSKVPDYQYTPIAQSQRPVVEVKSCEILDYQYEQAKSQFKAIKELPYDGEARAEVMVYQKDTWPDIIQMLMEERINSFLSFESDEEEAAAQEGKTDDTDKVPSLGIADKYSGLGPADFED